MKSRKALLSLLKVYPGNLQTWTILALGVALWGWKWLIISYVFSVSAVVIFFLLDEGIRERWFSKNQLGKDDWLVQWFCCASFHVWGSITVDEPRTVGADLFLNHKMFGKAQRMRIGSGECVFCRKKENFVSFHSRNQHSGGPVLWDPWTKMAKGFYEMYREEQESAE